MMMMNDCVSMILDNPGLVESDPRSRSASASMRPTIRPRGGGRGPGHDDGSAGPRGGAPVPIEDGCVRSACGEPGKPRDPRIPSGSTSPRLRSEANAVPDPAQSEANAVPDPAQSEAKPVARLPNEAKLEAAIDPTALDPRTGLVQVVRGQGNTIASGRQCVFLTQPRSCEGVSSGLPRALHRRVLPRLEPGPRTNPEID
jgi:hypothetical protein